MDFKVLIAVILLHGACYSPHVLMIIIHNLYGYDFAFTFYHLFTIFSLIYALSCIETSWRNK